AVGYAREAQTQSGMSDGQVTGATSSYARKYSLNGLFAIDDTKDLDSDEYQANGKKNDSDKTPKTPVKPSEKPWLNETDEAYTKAVEALKSKRVTMAQILGKYKLSTAVRAKLEALVGA